MSNMSRAEAISILKKLKLDAEEYGKESDFVKQAVEVFEFAIASLEADEAYQLMEEQPEFCEDCISKSDALDSINWAYNLSDAYEKINMLPSVLPKADKPTIIDWNNCHTPEQLDSISTTKNDLGVDCISRQAAIDAIRRIHPIDTDYDCTLFDKVDVMYVLNDLPSATPQEPKTGHWNEIPKYKDIAWRCSECEHFTTMKHNYCPNCGCRMVEPQESEDKE